jgi:hypothetical protein
MIPPRATPDIVRSAAFRIRGKIFGQLNAANGTALVKISLDEQAELVQAYSHECTVPAHGGSSAGRRFHCRR